MESDFSLYAAEGALKDGRLRQAQLKMLAMLEVVDAICQKHGLDYWLDAGTLLGAVRHKGFIPWDDDIDIAMPRASYEAFLRLAPAELPANLWLQTAQSDPGFFNMATPLKIRDRNSLYIEKHEQGNEPYVQGIFMDVFVYDNMPDSSLLRKYYKFIAKKISRVLHAKYSAVTTGHHSGIYKIIGQFISKFILENYLKKIINKANKKNTLHLGRGYNCVGANFIPYKDIYPLQRGTFESSQFNIPNRPEVLLTQQYGDYMILPAQEHRTMRHCKVLIPEWVAPH